MYRIYRSKNIIICSIKKALIGFLIGAFLFNDIAYAADYRNLSPEIRLTRQQFKEDFKAGYTLLANEAVNEYIGKYLATNNNKKWWKNSIVLKNTAGEIVNQEFMVVSIPGLLKNTGQIGHVGLGRVNGFPVIYMDSAYYYDQAEIEKAASSHMAGGADRKENAILHDIEEIRQYEEARHVFHEDLRKSISYDEMRRRLNDDPEMALRFHKESRPLDRLYEAIRLDPAALDLDAIYELYRKHGLASNTPVHPLAAADKSHRGGVNISAGPSGAKELRVEVIPDESYDVMMSRGVFNTDNELLKNRINGRKAFFVVDKGIGKKSIAALKDYIVSSGIVADTDKDIFFVSGGERVKNGFLGLFYTLWTAYRAWRSGLDKKSVFVLVGGGATLDMSGFAASIFHRGISHIRIPTTLLSQDDAGVGVKNGINFFSQKNFIGAFKTPDSVIIDPILLATADERIMSDGLAEIIKVALMKDRKGFELLEANYRNLLYLPAILARAKESGATDETEAALKSAEELIWLSVTNHLGQIKTDPYEKKLARPLDYGHEWGHRLETVTSHRLSHGQGVAIGMAIDSHISMQRGMITKEEFGRIINIIRNAALPAFDRQATFDNIWPGLKDFRKHLGGELTISLLKGIGEKEDVHEIKEGEVKTALEFLRNGYSRAPPGKVAFVMPMYTDEDGNGEAQRMLPKSDDNPAGEDALRMKVAQLESLHKENPNFDWRIIAVDDGSPGAVSAERVRKVLEEIAAESGSDEIVKKIDIIVITPEQKIALKSRKGGAVLRGFSKALHDGWADYIGYTDTDVSADLRQTKGLVTELASGRSDVAIGSRWAAGAHASNVPLSGTLSSRFYNWCVRLVLPPLSGIRDTQRGFKLFRKDVIEKILFYASDQTFSFDTELLLLARLADYRVKEMPIVWVDSPRAATLNMFRDAPRMFLGLLRQMRHLFYNPFAMRPAEYFIYSVLQGRALEVERMPVTPNKRYLIKIGGVSKYFVDIPDPEQRDVTPDFMASLKVHMMTPQNSLIILSLARDDPLYEKVVKRIEGSSKEIEPSARSWTITESSARSFSRYLYNFLNFLAFLVLVTAVVETAQALFSNSFEVITGLPAPVNDDMFKIALVAVGVLSIASLFFTCRIIITSTWEKKYSFVQNADIRLIDRKGRCFHYKGPAVYSHGKNYDGIHNKISREAPKRERVDDWITRLAKEKGVNCMTVVCCNHGHGKGGNPSIPYIHAGSLVCGSVFFGFSIWLNPLQRGKYWYAKDWYLVLPSGEEIELAEAIEKGLISGNRIDEVPGTGPGSETEPPPNAKGGDAAGGIDTGLGIMPFSRRAMIGNPAAKYLKAIFGPFSVMFGLWAASNDVMGSSPGELQEKPAPETVLQSATRKVIYENWMSLYSYDPGSRRMAVEHLGPLVAALIRAGEEVDLKIFVDKLDDEEDVSYAAAEALRQINLALIEKNRDPVGVDEMRSILKYSSNTTAVFFSLSYFLHRAAIIARTLGDIDEALIVKGKPPLSIKEIKLCLSAGDDFLRGWAIWAAEKINKISGKDVFDPGSMRQPKMISQESMRKILRSSAWAAKPGVIVSGRNYDFHLIDEGKNPIFITVYKEELPDMIASFKKGEYGLSMSDLVISLIVSAGEIDAALLIHGKEAGDFKIYTDLLKDENTKLCCAAIRAVSEIGCALSEIGRDVPFLDTLKTLMESDDGQISFAAVREMARIKYHAIQKNKEKEGLDLLSHFEGKVHSLLISKNSKGKTEYNRIILAYVEALELINLAIVETGSRPRTSVIYEALDSGNRELARTALDALARINTALLKAGKPCIPLSTTKFSADEYISDSYGNSAVDSMLRSFIESGKFRYDNAGFLVSKFWLENELLFDRSILGEYFSYPDAAVFLHSLETRAQAAIEQSFDLYGYRPQFFAYLAARLNGILVSFGEFVERLNIMSWYGSRHDGYVQRLFEKGKKLKALEISASGIRELDIGRVDKDALEAHLKDLEGIKSRVDDFLWLVEGFPGYKLFSLNNLYFQFKREKALANGELKSGERFHIQYPADAEMEAEILQDKTLLLNLILRNVYYQMKREEAVKGGQLKEGERFRIEFPAAEEIKKELVQKRAAYYKLVFSILAGRLSDKELHDKCVISMRDLIISQILEDRTFIQQIESPNTETKLQMLKVLYEDYVNHLPGIAGMNLGELNGVSQALKTLASPFYEEASKTQYVLGTTKHGFTLVPAGFLSFCHGRAGIVDCAFDMDKGQAFTRAMHEDTEYYFIYKAKELIGYVGLAWGKDDSGNRVLTIDSIESPIFDGEELIMNLLRELHEYAVREGAIGIVIPRDIHFYFNFDNQDTVGNLKVYREGEPIHIAPVHYKSWRSMTEWFGRTGDDRYIGNSMDSEEFVLLRMSEKQRVGDFSYEIGKMAAADAIRGNSALTPKNAKKILERMNDTPGFTWKYAEWGVNEKAVVEGDEKPGLDGFLEGFRSLGRFNRWSLIFHANNQDGRGDIVTYFLLIMEDMPELSPFIDELKKIRKSCSKKSDTDDMVRRDLTAIGFMEELRNELRKMSKNTGGAAGDIGTGLGFMPLSGQRAMIGGPAGVIFGILRMLLPGAFGLFMVPNQDKKAPSLGRMLKDAISQKGVKVNDAVRKIGIAPTTLFNILSGKTKRPSSIVKRKVRSFIKSLEDGTGEEGSIDEADADPDEKMSPELYLWLKKRAREILHESKGRITVADLYKGLKAENPEVEYTNVTDLLSGEPQIASDNKLILTPKIAKGIISILNIYSRRHYIRARRYFKEKKFGLALIHYELAAFMAELDGMNSEDASKALAEAENGIRETNRLIAIRLMPEYLGVEKIGRKVESLLKQVMDSMERYLARHPERRLTADARLRIEKRLTACWQDLIDMVEKDMSRVKRNLYAEDIEKMRIRIRRLVCNFMNELKKRQVGELLELADGTASGGSFLGEEGSVRSWAIMGVLAAIGLAAYYMLRGDGSAAMLVSSVFGYYLDALTAHPWPTKILTALILGICADVVAQNFENRKIAPADRKINYKRLAYFSIFQTIFGGILYSLWLDLMDWGVRAIIDGDLTVSIWKIALMAFPYTPAYYLTCFAYVKIASNLPMREAFSFEFLRQNREDIYRGFGYMYKWDLLVWTLVINPFNFIGLPFIMEYCNIDSSLINGLILLSSSMFTILWDSCTSTVGHKTILRPGAQMSSQNRTAAGIATASTGGDTGSDPTILGTGGRVMERAEHEEMQDRLKVQIEEIALALKVVCERLRDVSHAITEMRFYKKGQGGWLFDMRLAAQEILANRSLITHDDNIIFDGEARDRFTLKVGSGASARDVVFQIKRITINSNGGGRRNQPDQRETPLESYYILEIIDSVFDMDHAGRNALTVYAHNQKKAVHELSELWYWIRFARQNGIASRADIDGHELGDKIRIWANTVPRNVAEENTRLAHDHACLSEIEYMLKEKVPPDTVELVKEKLFAGDSAKVPRTDHEIADGVEIDVPIWADSEKSGTLPSAKPGPAAADNYLKAAGFSAAGSVRSGDGYRNMYKHGRFQVVVLAGGDGTVKRTIVLLKGKDRKQRIVAEPFPFTAGRLSIKKGNLVAESDSGDRMVVSPDGYTAFYHSRKSIEKKLYLNDDLLTALDRLADLETAKELKSKFESRSERYGLQLLPAEERYLHRAYSYGTIEDPFEYTAAFRESPWQIQCDWFKKPGEGRTRPDIMLFRKDGRLFLRYEAPYNLLGKLEDVRTMYCGSEDAFIKMALAGTLGRKDWPLNDLDIAYPFDNLYNLYVPVYHPGSDLNHLLPEFVDAGISNGLIKQQAVQRKTSYYDEVEKRRVAETITYNYVLSTLPDNGNWVQVLTDFVTRSGVVKLSKISSLRYVLDSEGNRWVGSVARATRDALDMISRGEEPGTETLPDHYGPAALMMPIKDFTGKAVDLNTAINLIQNHGYVVELDGGVPCLIPGSGIAPALVSPPVAERFSYDVADERMPWSGAEVTFASEQNKKVWQEDRFVNTRIDLENIIHGNGQLMAVMDGHGGEETAEKINRILKSVFETTLSKTKGDVESALRETIRMLDEETKNNTSGTTFAAVYIPDDEARAYSASLGDSLIVIKGTGDNVYISTSHNVKSNPEERAAAENRGAVYYEPGYIRNKDDDILWGSWLAMSRALGNRGLAGLISREPELASIELDGDSVVVLATDGIPIKVSLGPQEVANRLTHYYKNAEVLVKQAVKILSDNATAVMWRPLRRQSGNSGTVPPSKPGPADMATEMTEKKKRNVRTDAKIQADRKKLKELLDEAPYTPTELSNITGSPIDYVYKDLKLGPDLKDHPSKRVKHYDKRSREKLSADRARTKALLYGGKYTPREIAEETGIPIDYVWNDLAHDGNLGAHPNLIREHTERSAAQIEYDHRQLMDLLDKAPYTLQELVILTERDIEDVRRDLRSPELKNHPNRTPGKNWRSAGQRKADRKILKELLDAAPYSPEELFLKTKISLKHIYRDLKNPGLSGHRNLRSGRPGRTPQQRAMDRAAIKALLDSGPYSSVEISKITGIFIDTVLNDLRLPALKDHRNRVLLKVYFIRKFGIYTRSVVRPYTSQDMMGILPSDDAEFFELLGRLLDPAEAEFIRADITYYDVSDEELGKIIGMTPEAIAQMRQKILDKLAVCLMESGNSPVGTGPAAAPAKPGPADMATEEDEPVPARLPDAAIPAVGQGGNSEPLAASRLGSEARVTAAAEAFHEKWNSVLAVFETLPKPFDSYDSEKGGYYAPSEPENLLRIIKICGIGSGNKVLDIGTGQGLAAALLATSGATVHTIEINRDREMDIQKCLAIYRKTAGIPDDRLTFEVADVLRRDVSSYDMVYFYFTWPRTIDNDREEGAPFARKLLAHLRGMKPGAVFATPFFPFPEEVVNDDEVLQYFEYKNIDNAIHIFRKKKIEEKLGTLPAVRAQTAAENGIYDISGVPIMLYPDRILEREMDGVPNGDIIMCVKTKEYGRLVRIDAACFKNGDIIFGRIGKDNKEFVPFPREWIDRMPLETRGMLGDLKPKIRVDPVVGHLYRVARSEPAPPAKPGPADMATESDEPAKGVRHLLGQKVQTPSEVLTAIRNGTEAGGLLEQALGEGVAINAEAAKVLEAVGVMERVEIASSPSAPRNDGVRYRFTAMTRGRNNEPEETRRLINVVNDTRVKTGGEECWLGRKTLSENETTLAREIIRAHVVDYIYGQVKEASTVQKTRTINIWNGYTNADTQKTLMQEIEKLTKEGPYVVNFCSIEELVASAKTSGAPAGDEVTILPRNDQTKQLEAQAGRVIFINTSYEEEVKRGQTQSMRDRRVGSDPFSLGQIEGLVGIGKAYLNDDDESFYRLYRMLAVDPSTKTVELSELKAHPEKFITELQFVLRPIAANNPDEPRIINERLAYLLREA